MPRLAAHTSATRRHGFAYLLVLALLTTAAILTYAAVASSALQSQVAANERAVAEAESAARSGVDLARHYLTFPHDSDEPLIAGDAGDVHFPGRSGIVLSSTSRLDIEVTNPDVATYDVVATGTSRSTTGEVVRSTAKARLVGLGDWSPLALAQFSGDTSFGSDVLIRGSLMTDGNFLGGGTVEGSISAANYASNPGWSAPPELPIRTLPDFDALNLVRAAGSTGFYLYNGQRCRMQRITSSTLTSEPSASEQNPGRVFYYDGSEPLELKISSGTFTGTLIVTDAEVHVFDNQDIEPLANLPALLTRHRVYVASGGRLQTSSITYLNDAIWSASTTLLLILRFDGNELLPAGLYNGNLRVNASEARVEPSGVTHVIPDLTDQGIEYDFVEVERWSDVN